MVWTKSCPANCSLFLTILAGIAMNMEEDQVGVVLLGDYTEIEEGDEVKRTGRTRERTSGRCHDWARGQFAGAAD